MTGNRKYSDKIVGAYTALSEWIVRALGQPPQWPLDLMEWVYYQSRFFPKECYSAVVKLEERGLKERELATLLRYPSSIGHWLYFPETHFGVTDEYWAKGLSLIEGVEFVEKTINFISLLRKGDDFCLDFKNILLKREEVEKAIEREKFIEVASAPEIPKTLSKLNMVLWHYCMLTQGGLRIHSQELHGPYKLNEKELLFIREYTKLRPTDLWKFTQNFPYEEMIFFEVYSDMEMKIDLLGHYWTSAPPYRKLVNVAVNADGKNLNVSEVVRSYKISHEVLDQGNSAIRSFRREDWVKKWIELGYFWLKPLKDVLGEDWQPPADVLKLANDVEEAKKAKQGSRRHIQLVGNAIANLPKEKVVEEIARMHLKTIYAEW